MGDVSDQDLLANWLGAFAVQAVDAQEDAMACSRRAADVAVLQTLRQSTALSIRDLAAAAGLSHSATVRVVDRLCDDGLASRWSGSTADGRNVTVTLTTSGSRQALRLQRLRLAALDDLLAPLGPKERHELAQLLRRLLGGPARRREVARRTCRFCDHRRCAGQACPVGCSVHDIHDTHGTHDTTLATGGTR